MVRGLAASSAMLSPVVQTVLQMGFEAGLVESLVQTKYLLTGRQYTSVSDLVSDVLQAEQEDRARAPQSRGSSQWDEGWGGLWSIHPCSPKCCSFCNAWGTSWKGGLGRFGTLVVIFRWQWCFCLIPPDPEVRQSSSTARVRTHVATGEGQRSTSVWNDHSFVIFLGEHQSISALPPQWMSPAQRSCWGSCRRRGPVRCAWTSWCPSSSSPAVTWWCVATAPPACATAPSAGPSSGAASVPSCPEAEDKN